MMHLYKFIQGILMSSRQLKKLNLLIEFCNSIFIKFYFHAYQNKLPSSLLQNKLACHILFYFKLLFTLQI